MFVIQRVRRNDAGHIVEVEGFARSGDDRVESQSYSCSVAELVSRINCGDRVVTVRGAEVKPRRVAHDLETVEDLPDSKPGARLTDLPTY
jgi:hypothetical protein